MRERLPFRIFLVSSILSGWCGLGTACAQVPTAFASSAVVVPTKPNPINLATALQLAQARSIDVQVAAERVIAASAQLDFAHSKQLPTIYLGGDYARQDGRIQDIRGDVFNTSRSSLMAGAGPSAVFSPSDAILAPLASRQVLSAREADRRATENDITLAVAEAYFTVQRARGDLSGALESEELASSLVGKAERLAAGLASPVEVSRAKTELSRRRQAVESARERQEIAMADLNRLLRLPQATSLEPIEPPQLRVDLFDVLGPVDDLIPLALMNRPELASQQSLVAATIARLKREKLRPLIPSLVLRGNATNPGGTLSTGMFGGGINDDLSQFNWRNSVDVQVLWELQGLGFGNRATIKEKEAENRQAMLEMLRVQDRVASEVVQAHSQATRAARRATLAEEGLKEARETVKTNLAGLNQTRRIGEMLVLVFRPQEVVSAVQALDQAYRDYFGAIADANQAQFRLYRALGHPAQCVLDRKAIAEWPSPAAKITVPKLAPNEQMIQPASHSAAAPQAASQFATDRRP